MNVVYLVQHPGIAGTTPPGWTGTVVTPAPDGTVADADRGVVTRADVLVVGLFPLLRDTMASAPRLKLVQRLGVGYDNVDVAGAAALGVPVCNMADFNAGTVAEHTIMMMLGLLRRVFEATLLMKGGRWPIGEVVVGNYDLAGRRVGLIGLGAIGEAVARLLRPFDVSLQYADRRRRDAAEEQSLGVEFAALDALLADSDVVSVHVPYTPDSRHLIGAREIAAMKPGALLINTARGGVVDVEALTDALRTGRLGGAGLDVYDVEPLPARHPLRSCPNVLLTPHTGGQTREAMARMVAMLRENLSRLEQGRPLLHQVVVP